MTRFSRPLDQLIVRSVGVLTIVATATLTAAGQDRRDATSEVRRGVSARIESSPASDNPRETPTVLAIRRAAPSVVNIHGQKTVRATAANMAGGNTGDSFKQVNGMGTGVIIDPRGYVVTNYHVVEDVHEINVTLADGSTAPADLIAARTRNDLAIIQIRTDRPLPVIDRGTSEDLMIGEPVIAIGNAYGYVHTTTQGIISALHRDVPVNETQEYRDLIQISAGINPGNSGGPLLNIRGEMIGINVAVRVGAQQIAFAIPVDQVVQIVTEMIERANEDALSIGWRIDGGPRDGDGTTVADVAASSPAAREGLKPGDRVVRVGSRPIDDRLDLALALIDQPGGEAIRLDIERNGSLIRVDLPPASLSPQSVSDMAWRVLGVRIRQVAKTQMDRLNARMNTTYQGGLTITAVRPGSAAAAQGIFTGDILLGIHIWETSSMSDLVGILEHPDIKRGPRAKFYIVRKEQTLVGHMQLAAQPGVTRR